MVQNHVEVIVPLTGLRLPSLAFSAYLRRQRSRSSLPVTVSASHASSLATVKHLLAFRPAQLLRPSSCTVCSLAHSRELMLTSPGSSFSGKYVLSCSWTERLKT